MAIQAKRARKAAAEQQAATTEAPDPGAEPEPRPAPLPVRGSTSAERDGEPRTVPGPSAEELAADQPAIETLRRVDERLKALRET